MGNQWARNQIAGKAVSSKITLKNFDKITDAEWDAAYNNAIKAGDMQEAQRLRDLHAATRGKYYITYRGESVPYDHPQIIYMKNNEGYNPYSDYRGNTVVGGSAGYYLSSSPAVANTYRRLGDKGPFYKLYSFMEKPYIIDANGRSWRGVKLYHPEKYPHLTEGMTTDQVVREAKATGNYDGVIIRNVKDIGSTARLGEASPIADDYVGFGGRTKLADAITYDDAGNIIPLSQRDNFNIKDIRYALLPFGFSVPLLNYNK